MALSLADAKLRIDAIFESYRAASSQSHSILSASIKEGKLYEAWVLSIILERLRTREFFSVALVNSDRVFLKSSPGPINPSYPHFVLRRGGVELDVWTDVEFLTLSYGMRYPRTGSTPRTADYHELDIAIVPTGVMGRPFYSEIRMGVECKNSGFSKQMARAAFGVRRELSLLVAPNSTGFDSWPRSEVPARPPSVFSVYSTDPNIRKYDESGQIFGIDFIHEPM